MILNDKVYDALRVIQDILPVLATLSVSILTAFGVSDNTVTIVGGVCTALEAALVSFLRLCKKKYDDEIENSEDTPTEEVHE